MLLHATMIYFDCKKSYHLNNKRKGSEKCLDWGCKSRIILICLIGKWYVIAPLDFGLFLYCYLQKKLLTCLVVLPDIVERAPACTGSLFGNHGTF